MARGVARFHPKYPPLPEIVDGHNEARLFDNAEQVLGRVEIPPQALDFLWARAETPAVTRAVWERQIRRAFAIDLVLRTYFRRMPFGGANFGHVIDTAAAQRLKDAVAPAQPGGRGTLMLTFHGGFPWLARMLFAQLFADGLQITANAAGAEARTYLFTALRKLEQGQPVLLAPEGDHGRQSGMLRVFDKTMPAGEGAAFLAYTSGCPTAWYSVKRVARRFIPTLESGPRRDDKESYPVFRHRLFSFCSAQIEAVASGDPRNLMLASTWMTLFRDDSAV